MAIKRINLYQKIPNKLIKELGHDVHTHGFELKTWTQEQTNYPREVAEKQLAHSLSNKAEAAYARSELIDKRRSLLETWVSYLEDLSAKCFLSEAIMSEILSSSLGM